MEIGRGHAPRDRQRRRKADAFEGVGEAAFYGPKLDFMAKDALGREHQVATIQLDMNMPERFDLFCMNEKGEHERIVMIHAAIMGSIERFLAVIIEHFAGAFPVWLAPVQATVLPISEKFSAYGEKVYEKFTAAGIRAELSEAERIARQAHPRSGADENPLHTRRRRKRRKERRSCRADEKGGRRHAEFR